MIKTTMKLSVLTACMCLAHQGYALEQIDEQELSDVTGQDGIVIKHEVSRVKIEQANWYDQIQQQMYKWVWDYITCRLMVWITSLLSVSLNLMQAEHLAVQGFV